MHNTESARDRIRPFVERARRFSGWQLDDFEPKPLESEPPWNYEARAAALLRNARSVLDLGTGGGERFEALCSTFNGRATATESWSANVPIAAARLQPHGIAVVRCSSLRLPLRDSSVELVLNRHEELDPAEIARILRARGRVLTQQIGQDRWRELRAFFPRMQDFGDLFHIYRRGFEEAGLSIVDARAHDWKTLYRGLGEVVFLLCVAPWEIPDFDPLGSDLPALIAAEESLSTDRGIALTESRFILEARNDVARRLVSG